MLLIDGLCIMLTEPFALPGCNLERYRNCTLSIFYFILLLLLLLITISLINLFIHLFTYFYLFIFFFTLLIDGFCVMLTAAFAVPECSLERSGDCALLLNMVEQVVICFECE